MPIKGSDKEKQTNEIKTAIPLLDCLDIQGKTITADALLTQRGLAKYLVERHAHYHFTAKDNQKNLLKDVASFFENVSWDPDYTTKDKPNHGRKETRKIWVTTDICNHLDFPHVGQAFKIERITYRKNRKNSRVVAYGITSKTPQLATAEQILRDNRQHWSIESVPQAHSKEVLVMN